MKGKTNSIATVTLQQIMKIRRQEFAKLGIVQYGNHCIVGHDIHLENLERNDAHRLIPIRINATYITLCLEGEIEVYCDSRIFRIEPNSLFVSKPGSVLQIKKGGAGSLSFIMSDERLYDQLSISFKKLLPHYSSLDKLAKLSLTPDESKFVNSMLIFLSRTISGDNTQMYYHECVRSQLTAFAYEIIALFAKRISEQPVQEPHTNHEEEYFRQFVKLLDIHFREEHRVRFYADNLHITPKYLSTVIAHLTGRTPSKWIDEYLIEEARMLLRNTDLSIQQIAYALHFPNQSFFGKFFKQRTGLSPTLYRQ